MKSIPVQNKFGINASHVYLDKKPGLAVRLRTVRDWEGETFWISNKLTTEDMEYYIVVRLIDMPEWTDQYEKRYHIEAWVVAPGQLSQDVIDSYLSSEGLGDDEFESESDPEWLAVNLVSGGCGAIVWYADGDNRRKLYEAARAECQGIQMLLGFYLDQPLNRIGTTGWDMVLTGNIGAGMDRYIAAKKEDENE